VIVDAGEAGLAGDLTVPDGARGVVVFAHGSGSGRHSPRNRWVAEALQAHGLATLLLDLLTESEERDRDARFDIPLLARRTVAAVDWCAREPPLATLPAGCFGASTGAAAALIAAAERPAQVRAVVSRGGRPDLAARALEAVAAPVLLVVGGADPAVLELNRRALRGLPASARLEVVAGATHLFPEAGALERVADLASAWFLAHLGEAG
jgi:pimeloyl-ACP methyl ester carboxylesterase